MYIKSLLFSLFLMVTLLINSCNRCKNVLPPTGYFEIAIVDVNGNNLLGSTYNQPSFTLSSNDYDLWLNYDPAAQGEVLRVQYDNIETNKEYYLQLSSTETDTIIVNFNRKQEQCYDSFEPLSFYYNNQSLIYNQGVMYKVVK